VDPAGYPFVITAAGLALVGGLWFGWALAVPLALLSAFFVFFFRDPDRRPPAGDDRVVLAPADGRVLVAGDAAGGAAPPGDWRQISIFLSPLDVHVNRMPVSGRLTRINLIPGRFLPANHRQAAAINERSEIWVDHHGEAIVFRQVVGILARRVVCRATVGSDVQAGDRFGIMKFGSRMDVFLPPSATLSVSVGDRVRGGETVIAMLH
jgi:phosphatidylserine decarboxylase